MNRTSEQEPIYSIHRTEGGLGVSYRMVRLARRICDIREKRGSETLIPCVRYQGYWRWVYPAKDLLSALRKMRAEQYDGKWPDQTWRSFQPRKDEILSFILRWELPLGWYNGV
jgi:hypothetical protein